MVTRKRHIIDFADLNLVAVECGRCKTQVRMDLSRPDLAVAPECPTCQAPFEYIVHTLGSYRNVLKSVAANKQHRVYVEIDAAEAITTP